MVHCAFQKYCSLTIQLGFGSDLYYCYFFLNFYDYHIMLWGNLKQLANYNKNALIGDGSWCIPKEPFFDLPTRFVSYLIIFWVNCIVHFWSLELFKFYILKFENFDFTLQNLVSLAKSHHWFVLNVMWHVIIDMFFFFFWPNQPLNIAVLPKTHNTQKKKKKKFGNSCETVS